MGGRRGSLAERARRAGVDIGYRDGSGGWRESPPESVEAVLAALGPEVERPLGVSAAAGTGGEGTGAPARCRLPEAAGWGWAVQLYAARSAASWGIGDLGDLRTIAAASAGNGAAFLLLNALHAAAPGLPQEPSPYFPTSRRFRNPLYLRVPEVPGASSAAASLARLDAAGRALNGRPLIDRDAVHRVKTEALEALWAAGASRPGEGFERYLADEGDGLEDFATYCALAERLGRRWRDWPAELSGGRAGAVATFRREHGDRVRFHAWLQWLTDNQLGEAARRLPIVTDLALGAEPDGADSWRWQELLIAGVTIGAPPDAFNTAGQNWGLPAPHPLRLAAAGFAPVRETLRSCLRHAAGLRIDHVMGLFRLFLIPTGGSPADGVYLRYPHRDLLDVVAAESRRAGAFVVGEDLGLVEDAVREELSRRDILSYRLLLFHDGPPASLPAHALAAWTTHDLPTLAGLWEGGDARTLAALGRPADDARSLELRQRLAEVTAAAEGASTPDVIIAAHRALARAPSTLKAATLDDAAAAVHRPNLPGVAGAEWPSWCLPLPRLLEDILAGPLTAGIAAALSARRRTSASR